MDKGRLSFDGERKNTIAVHAEQVRSRLFVATCSSVPIHIEIVCNGETVRVPAIEAVLPPLWIGRAADCPLSARWLTYDSHANAPFGGF